MRPDTSETLESLKQISRQNPPKTSKAIQLLVIETIPTRYRENVSGTVFTAVGKIKEKESETVRVQFYDEWALGASFIESGDTLILIHAEVISPRDAGCRQLLITPCKSTGILHVLQKDVHGYMEITVTASSLDSPAVRRLPNNHHYVLTY